MEVRERGGGRAAVRLEDHRDTAPSPAGTPSHAWSCAVPSVVGNETLRNACPGGTSPLARIVRVWRPVCGSRPISRRGWPKSSQRQTISRAVGPEVGRHEPQVAQHGAGRVVESTTTSDVEVPDEELLLRLLDPAEQDRSGRRATSPSGSTSPPGASAGRSCRSPVRGIPDDGPLATRGVCRRSEPHGRR